MEMISVLYMAQFHDSLFASLLGRCVFQEFLLERCLLRPHQGVDLFAIDQKDKEGQSGGAIEIGQVGRLINVHRVQEHRPIGSRDLWILREAEIERFNLLTDTAPFRRKLENNQVATFAFLVGLRGALLDLLVKVFPRRNRWQRGFDSTLGLAFSTSHRARNLAV